MAMGACADTKGPPGNGFAAVLLPSQSRESSCRRRHASPLVSRGPQDKSSVAFEAFQVLWPCRLFMCYVLLRCLSF